MLIAQDYITGIRLGREFRPVGADCYISSAQSVFGGTSLCGVSPSGSTTGSYYVGQPLTGMAFGTGDFTIEFWWRAGIATALIPIDFRLAPNQGAQPTMFWDGSRRMAYFANGSSRVASAILALNTWYAVAAVRSSGVTKLYIDGVAMATTYADTTNYTAPSFYLAGNSRVPGSNGLNGFMDELRISKVARYTANYTPATEPFVDDINTITLLHFNGPEGSRVVVDDNT